MSQSTYYDQLKKSVGTTKAKHYIQLCKEIDEDYEDGVIDDKSALNKLIRICKENDLPYGHLLAMKTNVVKTPKNNFMGFGNVLESSRTENKVLGLAFNNKKESTKPRQFGNVLVKGGKVSLGGGLLESDNGRMGFGNVLSKSSKSKSHGSFFGSSNSTNSFKGFNNVLESRQSNSSSKSILNNKKVSFNKQVFGVEKKGKVNFVKRLF